MLYSLHTCNRESDACDSEGVCWVPLQYLLPPVVVFLGCYRRNSLDEELRRVCSQYGTASLQQSDRENILINC